MAAKSKIPVPTESDEQKWLFQWAADVQGKYPELALMFHIPNYNGIFIELKRLRGSKTSDEQKGWIAALRRQGYQAHVCKGWHESADRIEEYLKEGKQ